MNQSFFDVNEYISALPENIGIDGWKTVKDLFCKKLEAFTSCDFDSVNDVYKQFSVIFWQNIFDELIKNDTHRLKSFSTRLRYKSMLLKVGEI